MVDKSNSSRTKQQQILVRLDQRDAEWFAAIEKAGLVSLQQWIGPPAILRAAIAVFRVKVSDPLTAAKVAATYTRKPGRQTNARHTAQLKLLADNPLDPLALTKLSAITEASLEPVAAAVYARLEVANQLVPHYTTRPKLVKKWLLEADLSQPITLLRQPFPKAAAELGALPTTLLAASFRAVCDFALLHHLGIRRPTELAQNT